MNVQQVYEKLKKLVEEGHGNAVIVHRDTRSGVTENAYVSSYIEIFDGKDSDFYAELNVGDEYLPIF